MKYQKGFTIIELIAVVALLVGAGVLFALQKRDVEVYHQDSARKTSINAIHHHLEHVYYPANKSYPEQVNESILPGIDAGLLKDPSGQAINASGSSLRYEPTNCAEGKCKGYTLRANLEKEADFTKQSTNH